MPLAKRKEIRTVLFLAANPKGTPPLRLDEEHRRIKDSLKQSSGRGAFSVHTETAVTIGHIRRALLEHQPEVVHFGGHGAGTDGIVCEDETGELKLIPTYALAGLFKLVDHHVKCVVLNACFAEIQANEVVKHIECVVGMRHSIGDRAALKFAEGFYDALFSGKSFHDCYRWGINAIQLENIPEDLTPVINTKTPPAPPHKANGARPKAKSKSTTNGVETRPAVQVSVNGSGPSGTANPPVVSPTPQTEKADDASEHIRKARPWKLLLVASFVVGLIAALGTWALISKVTYQPLVGSYTQDTYEDKHDPSRDDTGFKLEAVHALASVSPDLSTGKLSMVEVSTIQVSYQNRVITTYTAVWVYKEGARLSPTDIRIDGALLGRHGLNEVNLSGIMPDDVARKFERFKADINEGFKSSRAELRLTDEGRLQKTVKYNSGLQKMYTYIRN